MARGGQVGGLRTAAGQAVPQSQGAESSLPPHKKYKWEFQSAKSSLTLSFEERITHWSPSGTAREEYPKTKEGSRLDMLRFEDNYYGTNDDELAKYLINMKDSAGQPMCRLDGQYWQKQEMVAAQRTAEVEAMRQRLASDPELARQVLKPSENEDFKLPPPPAA